MVVETTSDQDYACFLCGKWKARDINETCPNCGLSLSAAIELVGQSAGAYRLEEYKARGYYGATFRATNKIGKVFAAKICPQSIYSAQGKDFFSEIARYREIGAHPNIAELVDAGDAVLHLGAQAIPVYYIVMEWIDGITLADFIDDPGFSVSDMHAVSIDLCAGVARFEARNLWHNDLKADNILVKRLSSEELQARRATSNFIAKIVDSGSAVFRQSERHKSTDDLRFLAQHISRMCMCLLKKPQSLSKEDRYFLDGLGRIVARTLDEHPSRSIPRAQELLGEIQNLYESRLILDDDKPVELADPFAYLNANDLPGETYVNLLFSGRFPWLAALTSSDPQPMLITGPRGSGKTIFLRSLALKTRLHPQHTGESREAIVERVSPEAFAGFFVSARIEIGNHCPLTKLPRWAERDDLVNLYFNLLFAYVIVDTLSYATTKHLLDVDAKAEHDICAFVAEATGSDRASTFGSMLSSIQRLQRSIMLNQHSAQIPTEGIGPAFLSGVSGLLKRRVPFFRSRHIVFLLDDFSLPKVPIAIQRYLLPTIWNPGGGYTFRVTAHSESVALQDSNGTSYAHNREFTEINLGERYVNNLDDDERIEKIQLGLAEIFSKRFALTTSFAGKQALSILGHSGSETIAGEIRRLVDAKKLHTLRYYGWETVVRLCSGDISYVIDIVSNIVRAQPTRYPVGKLAQNKVIKHYARSELYRSQDLSATSCNLYEVALNFGKFSLFKLLHASVGEQKRPAEYLRIEVELERLSPDARTAIGELLRHGVFIDGGFSSSSRGTPARRLVFKKLFTPAFPTTYNSRDTWSMAAENFEEFIRDPKAFVKGAMGAHGISPEEQAVQMDLLFQRS